MTVTTIRTAEDHLQKIVAGKTVTLTPEQADAFGRELDALKERVIADLGERDVTYIRRIIKAQRGLEVAGRAMLFGGIFPPFWLAGTAMLGIVEDSRQHGDRPQHHARPVRLDRRSRRWRARTSNGTPRARPTSGAIRTTTCTTPTPTSSAWTATSATASCG